MKNKAPSLEEIQKILESTWKKLPKDNIVISTGRGGAIMYYEMLVGRELTAEEKDEIKDGVYELNNGFIEYKGKYI
jgi:hypothetical protein